MQQATIYIIILGLLVVSIGCVSGIMYMTYLAVATDISALAAIWQGIIIIVTASSVGGALAIGGTFINETICSKERNADEEERLRNQKEMSDD